MKRIVINLGIWIIIGLLLLTVFVPSMVAHVPTNPPDPALDATEVFFMDPAGAYSFNYGHQPNYGSYIRDFQWASPGTGWDRYLGMLSVPYVMVNGVIYTFATPAVAKAAAFVGISHWSIVFTYMPIADGNGDFHNFMITFRRTQIAGL